MSQSPRLSADLGAHLLLFVAACFLSQSHLESTDLGAHFFHDFAILSVKFDAGAIESGEDYHPNDADKHYVSSELEATQLEVMDNYSVACIRSHYVE